MAPMHILIIMVFHVMVCTGQRTYDVNRRVEKWQRLDDAWKTNMESAINTIMETLQTITQDLQAIKQNVAGQAGELRLIKQNVEGISQDVHDPLLCDSNWQYFNGKCYYVYEHQHYTYYNADTLCRLMGAKLVIIDNSQEELFLNGYCRAEFELWIGLTDRSREGVWKWVDNSPLTYSNWVPGEPNGGSNEDCVHLQDSDSGKWNDNVCTAKNGFICEKNLGR